MIFNLCVKVYLFLNCNKTVDLLNFYFSSKTLTMPSIIKIRNRTHVNIYLVEGTVLLKCFPMNIQIIAAQCDDLH